MDTHPGQWVICIGVALCVLLLEELVKVGHRWGSRARRMRPLPITRSRNRVAWIVMTRDDWTFLSNHGHVLVALARDPDARTRDIAEAVGITERAVQQIVADLVEHGYVDKDKVGRRNRYRVIRGSHFRHDLESGVTLGAFTDLVNKAAAGA